MEPTQPNQPIQPNPAPAVQPINPASLTDRNQQSQNLVQLSKVETAPEPPGFWQQLTLDFLSVAAALFFGYSYFLYLTIGASPWYSFFGLTAFAIVSGLQMFLAHGTWRRVLVVLGETVAIVIAFVFYDDPRVVLIAGAIVFLFLLWAYFGGRFEVQNEVEIRFFKATRSTIGKVTSAAILFLLVVYAPQAQGQGIFIPRSSFRTLFNWSAGILNNISPNLLPSGTFGDFAEGFVKAELQNNPSYEALSPASQQATLNQAVQQFSRSVEQTTGVAPTPSEPASDVAYDYIVATLSGWQGKFDGQFVIVWVIILFLVFRVVGFLFVFFAQLVMLLVYEVLIALGFMKIEGVPQTKEVVSY